MRVLLIHPPTSSKHPEPPLGIAYLAAYLRLRGHTCSLIDMDPAGLKPHDLPAILGKERPQLIGVSFMTPQFGYASEILQIAKNSAPSAVTVAGGPHSSSMPEDVLALPGVDFVVFGEGEETLAELIDVLDGNKDFGKVLGLAWKNSGGTCVVNLPRPLMPDIDSIPRPAWDLLRQYTYTDLPMYKREEVPVYPIITARGCPFECLFCDEGSIWKRKVRFRSIPLVLDEIEWLCKEYGARTFNVLDDTFTLRPERVTEFCQGLNARGLAIFWRCTAKSTTVTAKMLSEMAAAGCKLVGYGVESGNQQILNNIKKAQTLDDVRRAMQLSREAGLQTIALCIVGNLGETPETVEDTIRFVEEIQPDFATGAIMTPYPGSGMYRICKQNGWIRNTNWNHWIPTPHGIPNFRPVAVIADMDQQALLDAYYRFNARIIGNRFRRRYGHFYYLSPSFIRREVLHRLSVSGLRHFTKTGWRLLRSGLGR